MRPLLESVAHTAEQSPHALAVIGEGVRLSYAELAQMAGHIAAALATEGVRPGDLVALELPAALSVVATVATDQLGAASCVAPRGGRGLREAGVRWVLRSQPLPTPAGARDIEVTTEWLARARAAAPVSASPAGADALARVIFSSGTTGTPKAVPLTHRMVAERVDAARESWLSVQPFMSLLGLGTASGLIAMTAALASGGTYVVPSTSATNLVIMRELGIAAIKASPIQLEHLVREMAPVPTVLPELRRINSAGGFLPKGLAERLERVFACEVANVYGASEAGTVAMRVGAGDPHDAGTVVPGAEVQVVDASDRTVPYGQEGAVRFRRTSLPDAYLGAPESSREHLRGGWFYPGDRGILTPDGGLTIVGRANAVLNAAGLKVDPAVVEAALLELPGITEAGAFMASREGAAPTLGVAFVADAEPDVTALADALRFHLGDSAPLAFFRVNQIPRNDMGKVDREALAGLHAEAYRAATSPP